MVPSNSSSLPAPAANAVWVGALHRESPGDPHDLPTLTAGIEPLGTALPSPFPFGISDRAAAGSSASLRASEAPGDNPSPFPPCRTAALPCSCSARLLGAWDCLEMPPTIPGSGDGLFCGILPS